MATELWAVALVTLAALIGSFGPIFLKRGSKDFVLNLKKLITNYDLFLGIFFYAVSTALFVPALRGGELSVLYPLVATIYVWVSIWSSMFLKERMTRKKWFGVALIIIGVTLVGLGS